MGHDELPEGDHMNAGELDKLAEANPIGVLTRPCKHGNYVVSFYGATFTQSRSTGKFRRVLRHQAIAVQNAN